MAQPPKPPSRTGDSRDFVQTVLSLPARTMEGASSCNTSPLPMRGPLPQHRRCIFVECSINGANAGRAMIDTGAMRSIIDQRLLESLTRTLREGGGCPPPVLNWRNAEPLSGVGGRMLSQRVIVPELMLAGVRVCHPLIVMPNAPFSLIIGMDILYLHGMRLTSPTSEGFTLHPVTECYVCRVNFDLEREYLPLGPDEAPRHAIVNVWDRADESEHTESQTLCSLLEPGHAIHTTLRVEGFNECDSCSSRMRARRRKASTEEYFLRSPKSIAAR